MALVVHFIIRAKTDLQYDDALAILAPYIGVKIELDPNRRKIIYKANMKTSLKYRLLRLGCSVIEETQYDLDTPK